MVERRHTSAFREAITPLLNEETMTAQNIATASATPIATAPFSVGNFDKGECRGDLQKQWMARPADERFLNLSDLREFTYDRYQASKESRVDTRKVEFFAPSDVKTVDDTHRLMVGTSGTGDERAPTHWSFGQLARLAGAPAEYLRRLPTQIVADAMSFGLRYARDVEQVKLYSNPASLMAATGPDYGRIFDYEVVDAVRQIAGNGIGDSRWKIPGMLNWSTMKYNPEHPVSKDTTTLYASDRDVFIFLVDDRNPIEVGKLPNGDPDLMFRGFYVTNSEMGNGKLRLAAFYLRGICCNRLMWGVEGFQEVEMIHSKNAPSRFIEEIRPALVSYSENSSMKLIEGVAKAKAALLVADKDEALAFLNNRGLSRKKALAVFETAEREEGHEPRSAWDLAQGITAVARTELNTDTRMTLEIEAKRILDKVA